MERLRIDHVITRLILGGAQENTVLTCEGLQADPRYDVRLVTGPALGPEGDLLQRARSGGYPVEVVGSLRRAVNPWRDLVAFWRLWRLFRNRKPHIVHTHSSKAGILGRIAARLAGVPIVVHTIHGLPFHEHQSRTAHWIYRTCERICGGMADRLVCVGEVMKGKSIAAGLAGPERFTVIYSGMDVAAFDDRPSPERERLGFRPDEVVIAVIARLAPLKGHGDVLEAVRAMDARVRLLFVGDGELRGDLERAAAGRAVFTGLVPPDEIPGLLRASDVVVHPSLREGLPRAAVQALLCGRPVVAADADGAREVVISGETGFLVPPGDPAALRSALERLIALPDRGRSMGIRGRGMFLERFDHRAMVRDLKILYEERVKGRAE